MIGVENVPGLCQATCDGGYDIARGDLGGSFALRDPRGREIDVHAVRFNERGDGIYRTEGGTDRAYPARGFEGHGRVENRFVRCLTPEIQVLCHVAAVYPFADDHHRDLWALHDRFGVELPEGVPRPDARS